MRRVVVTGIGMVSPLAPSAKESWSRLLNCESGVRQIVSFDVSDLASKVAGQVPTAETAPNASTLFDPLKYVTTKELGRVDKFILFALASATDAMEDSGLIGNLSDEERERFGVIIGSGIGGLPAIYNTAIKLGNDGARHIAG